VSFSPEKEHKELPLLTLVPGGDGTFPDGGGPLISPAKTGAAMRLAPIAHAITRRIFVMDVPM
jgi:hypothetical protein